MTGAAGSGFGKAVKYISLFPIAYLSLLAGASIVHNIYQPDLTIPDLPPAPPSAFTTQDEQDKKKGGM